MSYLSFNKSKSITFKMFAIITIQFMATNSRLISGVSMQTAKSTRTRIPKKTCFASMLLKKKLQII